MPDWRDYRLGARRRGSETRLKTRGLPRDNLALYRGDFDWRLRRRGIVLWILSGAPRCAAESD